jgi:aryl-alcohol dehydrogenase-like predicted oxidoreductase
MAMQKRTLGSSGLQVSAIGLGCFGMAPVYGTPDDDESIATIHRALDLGVNFFDTADVYGNGSVEALLGRALEDRRKEVIISTKFGNLLNPDGSFDGVDGSRDHCRRCCETSLQRMNLEVIDVFSVHRVDPDTPIETTMEALAELVDEGLVRAVGLSEAGPETIRRANAVHPVAALQTEYALWSRDPEKELLGLCKELDIGFVAYSPLGRGFLTGRIQSTDNLEPTDKRPRTYPRFQPGNFEKNLEIVRGLEKMADEKGCSPAQLVLAWVLAQGDHIVPIPGTKRRRYVEENVMALEVSLTPDDLASLDNLAPVGSAAGDRYPQHALKKMDL